MLKSFNPATGELVGEVPTTPSSSIPELVARSKAAQKAWAKLSVDERIKILTPIGDAILADAEEMGELLTREMGKPLAEGIGEVKACGSGLEDTLKEIAEAIAPQTLEDATHKTMIYRDPLGVAACITPWNFPILMPHQQVIPALVAGNAVVMKPSEETPLIAQAYADRVIKVLSAAGHPDLVQIVHGADDQGKALVAADVDLIVFTGSREVGKLIMAEAAKGLKRLILELGGKDPMIVLEDADLDAAAQFAARNAFRNAGQVCVSTERIFVADKVHDDFVAKLRDYAAELVTGDGMDPASKIGPMVSSRQRDHVVRQVRASIGEGATLEPMQVPGLGDFELADSSGGDSGVATVVGNFLKPMILTGVTHNMEIAREETFGPVACITKVASDDEALEQANDTPFGLGAVVYGEQSRAEAVARQLTAGMIGVNQGLRGAAGAPWVGAKESGFGFHSGPEGHRQFTQIRAVSRTK